MLIHKHTNTQTCSGTRTYTSVLIPASVHSDGSSKHTCTILASIDHSRYPHFCSFGSSSALQILALAHTRTRKDIDRYYKITIKNS